MFATAQEGKIDMGAYRMRFLWPDEIDADQAHYQKLLERWGSDEAIDDMEHAFGSIFWQMPERVPCVVALDAQTGQAAREEAAVRWQRHPRLDGRAGYAIVDQKQTLTPKELDFAWTLWLSPRRAVRLARCL